MPSVRPLSFVRKARARLNSTLWRRAQSIAKSLSRAGLYEFVAALESSERGLGDVLHIGSGGALEEKVRRLSFSSLTTLDIDSQRAPDIVSDVTSMPFADDQFDTVFLLEVLEHVKQPSLAASEILRVLKPEGRLYVSTPFMIGMHDMPYDYFRYTSEGLREIFRGFLELRIDPRSGSINAALSIFARDFIRGFHGRGWKTYLVLRALRFASIILSPLEKELPSAAPTGFVAIFEARAVPTK